MDLTATLAREFERESFRIDQLIWDAMALHAGESALFCGFANNAGWIKRAVEIGVDVSVVANDAAEMRELGNVPVTVLRGSTAMLPARDASFDATVAFHYLHEVDPFFHSNIVSELGRVGKRCVIVEPAPPTDPLGKRIASLYSRAKRELGQFENYHPIDYWRKLLAIVKPEVTYQTFNFMRNPPREAIRETVALIIDMMAAEETPEAYLEELRALAKRPDAQLLPQARYVIVGIADGVALNVSAGTSFREHVAHEVITAPPAASFINAAFERSIAGRAGSKTSAVPSAPRVYSQPDAQAEFPAIDPPPPVKTTPPTQKRRAEPAAPQPAGQIARNAFGLPTKEKAGDRGPVVPSVHEDDTPGFGLPDEPADAAAEFGWEWETPGEK